MHAQAEERALHITENRRQRRHGDRNDVGKRALRNSNRLREKLLHGGSFFWFGDRLHTTCRQKEPPPQLIRSTDSGTSPITSPCWDNKVTVPYLGSVDFGGPFWVRDLAIQVYRAMEHVHHQE